MTEYTIPDRTTTEVLNASPLLLYGNLVENLQNRRHWRGFYADEYTAENGLHVRLVCGVTSAFIREDNGDQYGFVVRIVDVDDVHTKVFITSSYANTRDSFPASMPDAGISTEIIDAQIDVVIPKLDFENGLRWHLKSLLESNRQERVHSYR